MTKELINKLKAIAQLGDGWNGNGASKFSEQLINKTKDFIDRLNEDPEVFPTANDSIQLEYEIEDDYLQINIFEDKIVVFHMYKNKIFEATLTDSNEDICNLVNIILHYRDFHLKRIQKETTRYDI